MTKSNQSHISIRKFQVIDIQIAVDAFASANWPKSAELFENYLQKQLAGTQLIWVAYVGDDLAGYVTLKWHSQYESFAINNIPEIVDLNVLPPFRQVGVGSLLLEAAEQQASTKSDVVGIGVGLYGGQDKGYGPAQRLYIKHGYIPDGKGATYNYRQAIPGDNYPLDDELTIWLTKKLKQL